MVKQHFDGQNIAVLDWPGNSPDINQTDDWQPHMKDKVVGGNTSSVPGLITAQNLVDTDGQWLPSFPG